MIKTCFFRNGSERKKSNVEESDSSDEESDNTVYECPGLAPVFFILFFCITLRKLYHHASTLSGKNLTNVPTCHEFLR